MYIILIILCKQMRSTPTKVELTQVTVNSTFTPWRLPTIGGTTQKYTRTKINNNSENRCPCSMSVICTYV